MTQEKISIKKDIKHAVKYAKIESKKDVKNIIKLFKLTKEALKAAKNKK
jgi:hypothetical protein